MATLTRDDAVHLHTILDNNIGVFRESEMPVKAQEYHDTKKNEFLDIFTTQVPESYWFQGTEFRSLSLVYTSEDGFQVVSEIEPEHRLFKVLDQTNRKIREAKLLINS